MSYSAIPNELDETINHQQQQPHFNHGGLAPSSPSSMSNNTATTTKSYLPHSFPPVSSSSQVRPLTHLPSSTTNSISSSSSRGFLQESIKRFSERLEQLIESVSQPLKPHLNKLGRFLLVATFLEDALRIASQYHEQSEYLVDVRGLSKYFAIGFLVSSVVLMVACSLLIVVKRWSQFSFPGLLVVIVSQGVVYDLYTDPTFLCLNLSILGALMLGLSDTLQPNSGRRTTAAGLPDVSEDRAKARQTYLQLAGRILLVVFFVGHAMVAWVNVADELTLPHILGAIVAVLACVLVAVGFKARWSAVFLVIISSVVNVMANDWWTKPKDHPERDFRRFDFFQALSIVGGMILLINQGPGGMSFDAKRKNI